MSKKKLARAFILAGLLTWTVGLIYCFAGQAGMGLSSRLADHQHTGAGDGAVLQGLAPVGNFDIAGNNAGNIAISSFATGSHFIWKPASSTFIAGQATDNSFYVDQIGKYSWIGGYNSSSPGDYSLAFGTYVKNNRAASMLLGYYLKNNAVNSIMIGSGPGFGGSAYAVNDDTGSIKFFPFTTTSETRPMLNMKRDNTAEAVGIWNFTSTPTINGTPISTATTYQVYNATDNTKVLKTGDTMTGQLTISGSSFTVSGAAGIGGNVSLTGTAPNILLADEGVIKINNLSMVHYSAANSGARFATDTGKAVFPNASVGINYAIGDSVPAKLSVKSAASPSGIVVQVSSQNASGMFFINGAGNVGIGAASVVEKLEVTGNIKTFSGYVMGQRGASDVVGTDSIYGDSGYWGFRTPSGNHFAIDSYNGAAFQENLRITKNGLIGIGTADPKATLHISSSTSGGESIAAILSNSFNVDNTAVSLGFNAYSTSNLLTGKISGIHKAANDYPMAFYTYNVSGLAERMRIDKDGNLGIGTSSPVSKLELSSGTLSITGIGAALSLGGRSQIIGYAPVYISTGSTIATNATASRTCLTSGTITQAGSRFVSGNGTLQVSQAGAPGNMSYWLEKNGVGISTWTLQLSAGDSETFPITYSNTASTAGSVTYSLCVLASGGTSTINQHTWYIKED